ncbi:MAG: hypothetical protein K0S55_1923 [Clostridia bacterium]|nr:hypothetical protein [Clostridia bacterium]
MDYFFLLPVIPGMILFLLCTNLYYDYYKNHIFNKKIIRIIVIIAVIWAVCLCIWGILRNIFPPFFI